MLKMRKRRFSGSQNNEVSERELRNRETALCAAEEGIVLLKNDGMLPLDRKKTVGLFGSGAGCTLKGGTGSGDVCARETISIYQGMMEEGFSISSKDWINDYKQKYSDARLAWKDEILKLAEEKDAPSFFDVYATHPFRFPEGRKIVQEDLTNAGIAIYVISRTAGEGEDRAVIPGDYYLSDSEKRDISTLSDLCGNIILIINSGAQIDLEYIQSFHSIKAIIYISQPGMEGGRAVAKVLSGCVTPSGKLTDTWAVNYSDFPNAHSFSYLNGDETTEYYTEGIFVGYRYFDAYQIVPRYPFGYGLSYTDFNIGVENVNIHEDKTILTVKVRNTGNTYKGKEVVQVYLSCQQSERKELKKLVAFAKTEILAPGEEQYLTLSFSQKEYSYYCELESSWKVNAGTYIILVGNSSQNIKPVGVVLVESDFIIEKNHSICPLQTEMKMEEPDSFPIERQRKIWLDEVEGRKLSLKPCEEKKSSFRCKYEELASQIVKQLTDDQLTLMSVGEISKGHEVALGASGIMVPGAAGETSSCLEKMYQIPGVSMADGPAGLRIMKEYKADIEAGEVFTHGIMGALEDGLFLDENRADFPDGTTFYQYCTAFPVGVMLAQTWNTKLQRAVGEAVGAELQEMGISWWLAPGMNIHRNPLCGRNFEYFSEDPLISGNAAASITQGVQTLPGVGTTIKHFACNNLERNRMSSNSVVSERALREIYLRGFEIAIKSSQPMAVMSSYNLLNGIHTSSNYDLLTKVLRDEWGFCGIIMTDWTTTGKNGGSIAWKVMAAGGNLIMPGTVTDIDSISGALKDQKLPRNVLEERIKQLLIVIFQTNAYENSCSYQEQFVK